MNHLEEYKTQLSARESLLLKHYTCEIDPEDWSDTPLSISYEVVNFLLKRKHLSSTEIGYVPQLLKEKALSRHDVQSQIANAKELKQILERFPTTKVSITVYKGFLAKDAFFIRSASLCKGQQFMTPYFLSTTLNKDTAFRFTNRDGGPKCTWQITIPPGFPLAILSGGEQEVLINMGAVLECQEENTEKNHIRFCLKGFSKAVTTRSFWQTLDITHSL